MRILPVAVALSALAHGGLALGLALHKPAPALASAPAQADPNTPPPPRVDTDPIAVAFVDDRAMRRDVGGAAQHIAASSTRRGNAEVAAAPSATTEPGRSSLMSMRSPGQEPEPAPAPIKGISEDFLSRFLDKPSVAQPNPIEGEAIDDEIAAIRNDPSQRERLVALYAKRDAHELKRDGSGYKAEHQTWTAHVDSSGHATFEDKPNYQQHGLTGTFDITDAFMRRHGDDPYAAQKRKFLEDTLEERYQIGKRADHELLQHSGGLAYEALENVMAKLPDVRERKQAVFELWDDCAETGDPDRVEAGAAARAMILGFIQVHFVGDSAYTPDELAALNARKTSKATFAPYQQ